MALDTYEQYLLELINRARLDPLAEAQRYGLSDLNADLSPGTISAQAKQPLAANANLEAAAVGHSLHMLAVDQFQHEGIGNGTVASRAAASGYTGSTQLGENISWSGTTGTVNPLTSISGHQQSLFLSAGHRANILNTGFSEVGLGRELGQYTTGGTTYNASMLTEAFGDRGATYFVTGVVYTDSNTNRFYDVFEGVSGTSISVSGIGSTTSQAAGGYALAVSNGARQVTLGTATVSLTFTGLNVKLDLADGSTIRSSASVTAVSGVSTIELLGVDNLSATGTSGSQTLIGNRGNNVLDGGDGTDTALYFGNRANYSLTQSGSQWIVTDLRSGLNDGQDTLVRIEQIRFADMLVTLSSNTPPVVTAADQTIGKNQWALVQNWLSTYDADGNAITRYEFWDGGASATSAYFWTPSNPQHAANTTISIASGDLANLWIRGGQSAGFETIWVRAFDGTDWGAWDTFTLTTRNTPPVVSAADHIIGKNQWTAAQSLLATSDPNGDAITRYEFVDGGTGATSGHFWTPGHGQHAANTTISVAAADLGNVWIRGGQSAGSETMWVRAFDGTDWSVWDSFTLTSRNTAPIVTANDQAIGKNQWTAAQSLLSTSDANGDAITRYEFSDGGTGATSGHFWTPGHGQHAANTTISVAAADVGNVWIRGGQATGSETMWVRAFDGTDWSVWDSFTLTTQNTLPTVSVSNQSLGINQWAAMQNWLATYDADGDAIAQYEFWDGGTGASSGFFWTPGNMQHAANTTISVAGADIGNVWVRGGQATGSETMWVRAHDGTAWSVWDSFSLTTVA